MSLLVKSRDGMTAHLARAVAKHPDRPLRVAVDGPYGYLAERLLVFEDVLLVAGGIGCTFVQPLAQLLQMKGRRWRMVWSVREEGERVQEGVGG